MKMKTLIAAIVFVGAAWLSFWAVGSLYRQPRSDEQHVARRFERDYLRLTAAQQDRVSRLHQVMQGRMGTLRRDARKARLELIELLSQPQPDKRAIDEKLREFARLQEDIQREVVEHLLRVKQVLTEEQQKRLFKTICAGLCADESGRSHEGGAHGRR
jgi:Spy/CpxP family protein refolding chaperone